MKLKKITAAFLAVLLCVCTMSVSVSAAKKSIKLDQTKVTLSVGETCTLKPSVTGYKKATVQWSSSDKSVAAVSKGKVTAKKEGTATITVKIKGTDYKATCKVTVQKKSAGKTNTANLKSKYKTPQDIVAQMTVGWNLGNSLDCSKCTWLTNKLDCETAWGNPKTTKAMISAVKKAGFNTIRIPVSWGDHIDDSGKIDKAWLDRVQEVVDYAYEDGMFIILNVHHDNYWLPLEEKTEKETTKKYQYVWKQIAARFKDYDEKLLFEGRNEPRTEGSAKEWSGGTKPERDVINRMYEAFVSAVRAEGGYNKTRFLMVTPYAASTSYDAMADLKIPDDDRIIVSIHAYIPYNAAFNGNSGEKALSDSGKREIDTLLSNIDKMYLSKDIPVIIGEFGSVNKNNTAGRVEIAEYYVSSAKKYGVPCIWWDNNAFNVGSENFGLFNRKNLEWVYPEIVKALVDSAK